MDKTGKTKKVTFVGFWDTFDVKRNAIYRILEKHYDVELCDMEDADYSICSLYNSDFIETKGVRIFYTAEAVVPDFTLFDYCIGFDELEFGDRYIRIPNFLMNLKYEEDIAILLQRHNFNVRRAREIFCGWVCSNGNGDKARDVIFDELSKYKRIDSAGCYRNNIGQEGRVPDKRKFQKEYKFALATENTSYRGYTTEKLIEAFSAGGIPIYWGDPDVEHYFNPKAFINLSNYSSIQEGIEAVKRIDQNDELYFEMLSEKALNDDGFIEKKLSELENFLVSIFNQPIETAIRRPIGQTALKVENIVRAGLNNRENEEKIRLPRSLANLLVTKIKDYIIK